MTVAEYSPSCPLMCFGRSSLSEQFRQSNSFRHKHKTVDSPLLFLEKRKQIWVGRIPIIKEDEGFSSLPFLLMVKTFRSFVEDFLSTKSDMVSFWFGTFRTNSCHGFRDPVSYFTLGRDHFSNGSHTGHLQ